MVERFSGIQSKVNLEGYPFFEVNTWNCLKAQFALSIAFSIIDLLRFEKLSRRRTFNDLSIAGRAYLSSRYAGSRSMVRSA